MKIQSLSVCVPAGCLNKCKFCVAHMHKDEYTNQIEDNRRFYDLYRNDYLKRMQFARDNGCNTVILTGDGEPLLNRSFLKDFGLMNKELDSPFRWIELQTSGTLLDDEYLRFLRNHVGVNTISLSLSSIFDSKKNAEYNGTKKGYEVDIDHLCSEIKRYDFNLRLSLNLTDVYDGDFDSISRIFARAKDLGADQITFRVLYMSDHETEENDWIAKHSASPQFVANIRDYIINFGKPLEILPFGARRYSVHGISTVLDDDCMSQEVKDAVKYLILRPNAKLYSRWEDRGSLIF
ncbi:MAG TPA: radical SAM protein [Defluviitaleaceae bacterium]|nr:radical SAM protein [Defluviitaleaceae bacterium]